MKIQAISPVMMSTNCQPLKPARFEGKKAPEAFMKEQILNEDVFTPSNKTDEEKLDLACRIAAYYSNLADYYKAQNEELLANGCCLA